jgi:hypothetical protein
MPPVSKLAEKIRRAARTQPSALGFVTSRADKGATLVLAGATRDTSAAAELTQRGADVVVAGASGSAAQPDRVPGEAVVGGWMSGKADDESKLYREAGFDFVMFDPDRASATAVLDEGIGYVLSLPNDLTDAQIRALEAFQLDAIYIGKIDGSLTVRRQIELQRLFALARKPLMASVSAGIPATELRALRDANVAVVVVEGGDNVAKLRATIDALPPRARRKDEAERPMPLVPQATAAHEHDDDD